jgi:hypothetical protein
MRDMQALADTITLAVKAAMAPMLERLAAAEAKVARITETEQALGLLRDRVTIAETKAAMPVPELPEIPVVDLSPVLERLTAAETQLARLPVTEQVTTELRDRLVTIETKSAIPVPVLESAEVDLVPLEKRLDAIEARPVPAFDPSPLLARIQALEQRPQPDPVATEKEFSGFRERLAIVETRQPIPGPPGKDGANGLDGKSGLDGKDGKDGFSLNNFAAEFDGDRSLILKFSDGFITKSHTIRLPFMRQEGIYIEGKSYGLGDVVTWGGSQWHCNEDTVTKPGDGNKAWTLIVKRGRDGKDGRDAVPLPIVTVGAK